MSVDEETTPGSTHAGQSGGVAVFLTRPSHIGLRLLAMGSPAVAVGRWREATARAGRQEEGRLRPARGEVWRPRWGRGRHPPHSLYRHSTRPTHRTPVGQPVRRRYSGHRSRTINCRVELRQVGTQPAVAARRGEAAGACCWCAADDLGTSGLYCGY